VLGGVGTQGGWGMGPCPDPMGWGWVHVRTQGVGVLVLRCPDLRGLGPFLFGPQGVEDWAVSEPKGTGAGSMSRYKRFRSGCLTQQKGIHVRT